MESTSTGKWFEYHHRVTFVDTNMVGNVYFATYVQWMGKCRDMIMAEHYPQIQDHIRAGFGFATEYAHMDYLHETFLFDEMMVRMTVKEITRTRVEFLCEIVNQATNAVHARGTQAVVWVNAQHQPSLMPDELYEKACEYFGLPQM
jgi:enediyne biosynthesis thioesterase